jgi:hypothetical protein
VSVDEILTTSRAVKCKDVLLCTKLGFCSDPSDAFLGFTRNQRTASKMPFLLFEEIKERHLRCRSLISDFFLSPTSSTKWQLRDVGEILTVPPDGKYKDVLLCTKSGSCGDPSGRDPRCRSWYSKKSKNDI